MNAHAHNPVQMEEIRKADALIKEREYAERKSEPYKARDLMYIVISRYVTGDSRGLFNAEQVVMNADTGEELNEPVRKLIAEGMDISTLLSAVETAIRKRVFK